MFLAVVTVSHNCNIYTVYKFDHNCLFFLLNENGLP